MSARILAVLAGSAVALLLGSLSAQRASAAFPGTNGKIAFGGSFTLGSGISLINPDGTGQIQLTGGSDNSPAWSADGQKIALGDSSGIAVMNADATGRKQLTTGFADSGPSWSPDGKRIVFARDLSGSLKLEVMNAGGGGSPKTLTDGYTPAWSPDGNAIAFADFCGIYTIGPNGSGLTRLTFGCSDFEPSWSPDGARIVYASSAGLTMINADGTGATLLTTDFADASPAWSPDGSKIAFSRRVDVNPEVFVMNANGSGQTQLTFDTSWNFGVNWQPVPFTPADLALRLLAKTHVCPACPIRYRMKVWNAGPSAADDVVVSDPLPAGTSFVSVRSSRGSCAAPSPASGAVTCSLGSITGGTRVVIIVVCRVTGEGTITNRASVSSSTADPNPDNNAAVAVTEVR